MFLSSFKLVTKEGNKNEENSNFMVEYWRKELPYPILANKKSVAKMYLTKNNFTTFG